MFDLEDLRIVRATDGKVAKKITLEFDVYFFNLLLASGRPTDLAFSSPENESLPTLQWTACPISFSRLHHKVILLITSTAPSLYTYHTCSGRPGHTTHWRRRTDGPRVWIQFWKVFGCSQPVSWLEGALLDPIVLLLITLPTYAGPGNQIESWAGVYCFDIGGDKGGVIPGSNGRFWPRQNRNSRRKAI